MLRSLLCFTFVTVWLQAYDYKLQPKSVAEDVYCFFGKLENISKENGGNMVNTCYVRTQEGFVVIDSGPTYGYAKAAYEQMQRIAKLPVKYVIVTHDHDDHWMGNGFYKSKGALLIGPKTYEQNVAAGMQTRMERILGKSASGDTGIVPLHRVVEENLTLKVGKKFFVISKPVKEAHTKGDLIVWLPAQSVLFAGDLVFDGRLTSLRDGSILGSMKALEILEGYHPQVVIPGHGYNIRAEVLQSYLDYLKKLKQGVLDALENDVGLEKITQTLTLPQYRHLKLYDILHARNVIDAYRELEMYDEEE
ncbi:MAG: MBL fold metallo-hydrolase [Sulfurovum sp.]|nr:MBL fold metallo-hydrolase [Sulfurovum sp.]